MPDWVYAALASAAASYAAVSVHLSWLRRDVDSAHARIDRLPCISCTMTPMGRRAYDPNHNGELPHGSSN